jgi:hypothetical protein
VLVDPVPDRHRGDAPIGPETAQGIETIEEKTGLYG